MQERDGPCPARREAMDCTARVSGTFKAMKAFAYAFPALNGLGILAAKCGGFGGCTVRRSHTRWCRAEAYAGAAMKSSEEASMSTCSNRAARAGSAPPVVEIYGSLSLDLGTMSSLGQTTMEERRCCSGHVCLLFGAPFRMVAAGRACTVRCCGGVECQVQACRSQDKRKHIHDKLAREPSAVQSGAQLDTRSAPPHRCFLPLFVFMFCWWAPGSAVACQCMGCVLSSPAITMWWLRVLFGQFLLSKNEQPETKLLLVKTVWLQISGKKMK